MVDNEDLARLVSSKDVQSALLQVPEDFLHRVYNLVMEMNGKTRPESRSKEMLKFSGLASIHNDHSLVNNVSSLKGCNKFVPCTLCVEIKPKSGVFPSDLELNTCCRYCSQKAMKSYIPVSSYCPMDLYSKNFIKIKRAIEALVDSPQNNLRVFHLYQICKGSSEINHSYQPCETSGSDCILYSELTSMDILVLLKHHQHCS